MTIFRLVRQLERLGHRCRIVFTSTEGLLPREGVRLRDLVRRHFQPVQARCLAYAGQPLPDADVHVATHWDTAHLVDRRRSAGAGAYLVQDWEPSFHPAGTRAELADQTYSLGLLHLTAGPWLAARLRARGAEAHPFELAVDPADYFVEPGVAAPAAGRIAIYLRPLTPRRGFEVVCLALAELQRRRPDVELCVYGAAANELQLPFRATRLGVLGTAELRKLYCGSTAGLSCSLTNHSLVPQEMWACGLPVVEVDADSTRAVYRDGEDALLAPFEPRAMAARLIELLDSPELRQRLRQRGLLRAQQLSWEKSGLQVEAGLRRAVARALETKGTR
jgi:glycosyltransferase involved in cell wall biosynthesis